jgi:hypothetical protein
MRRGWNYLSIADQPGEVFEVAFDETQAVFSFISSGTESGTELLIFSNSLIRAA